MDKGIFGMVVQHLPSPKESQESKLSVVCPGLLNVELSSGVDSTESNKAEWSSLREAVTRGINESTVPTIAYVTKM
jgi:hypothetical protein